jgi:hypothetical protein
MKCALRGKEIRGRDYINASTSEKEIYSLTSCPIEGTQSPSTTTIEKSR